MSRVPRFHASKVVVIVGVAAFVAGCVHRPSGIEASGASGACPADVGPALGKACSTEGQRCGSERCQTAGGWCNFITCRSGTWQNVEVPPMAPSAETACAHDSDCGPARVCAFAIAEGCSAQGRCVSRGPLCNTVDLGCGCSGATVHLSCDGRPRGYASEPVVHVGPCAPTPPMQAPRLKPPKPGVPSICPAGGGPCGQSCCAAGEICCPGGMAGSYYCRQATRPGADCPALP